VKGKVVTDEELVNLAFEELGSNLIYENASERTVELMIENYGLDRDVAEEVVVTALDRWTDIYFPY
jgi:hypothetical protein